MHGTGGPDLRTVIADPERIRRLGRCSTPGQAARAQPATDRLRIGVRAVTVDWGVYGPAIARWESITRPAPDPTEPNKNGRPRLTVAFDEWMMGLPLGWIDDIDIPYGAKIKLCGNGAVPLQAEEAIRRLLT